MNNILRTITFSGKYCKMTILYQKLNVLKLADIQGVHKVRVHFKKFITLFLFVIEIICKNV